jgi:hypothetical protein
MDIFSRTFVANCNNTTQGGVPYIIGANSGGVNPGPQVSFGAYYRNSNTPTYAADLFTLQDVCAAGLNGACTLSMTHSGTSGAILFDLSTITTTKVNLLQSLSATLALSTAAIGAHTCAAAQQATITGLATSSVVKWSYASTPIGVIGYGDATTPFLNITTFATANTANVVVCNTSAVSITPGAISLNLRGEL